MPTVNANGINIYYERAGEGKPLVLISGLGYGLWEWHKMVAGLAEHFEVITFDNRGAGQTDKPEGPYNVEMLAADTAGLLDALDVDTAHVVGHSMGGFVAQQLALAYPDKIDKLVLASTNYGGPNHIPLTAEAMEVLSNREGDPVDLVRRGAEIATAPGFPDENPEVIEELTAYRLSGPVPQEAYQAQMAVGLALLEADAAFEHRLGKVEAETLILFGEHDKVVPPGNAELLDDVLPNSTVKLLPDAGHIFPIETPKQAVDALVEFLK